jgi:hypothetical protein
MVGGGPTWLDPLGRSHDTGLDMALDLLGWTCDRGSGGSAADAVPGSGEVLDSDHHVVVTAVADGVVHSHGPPEFPFATLPSTNSWWPGSR